ncbi:hypothetical protein [Methylobacterium sp. J-076]|uniref:hypothetical protein n=1 Tax=Methylobacterium sp. J-076 TaxID=2836655 RepID=UPI001FB8E544|nr:hypothetical protein [Methylobacterium sp. J-076]MCJ2012297.1 hypothetical protein [Methylobacterium sp. J-076]
MRSLRVGPGIEVLPSFQACVGILLLAMGLEFDHLACRRWRIGQHYGSFCIRTICAFAFTIAGVLLMLATC